MKEYNIIENLILIEGFNALTIEEKKELLLNRIREYLIFEASKQGITFMENATIMEMIVGLNFIYYSYKDRKKFNTKLLLSIINVMSNIQAHTIKYIKSKDINSKYSPVYTYNEEGFLSNIIWYYKIDNLSVVLSLIEYIKKRFIVTSPNVKKYIVK